MFFKNFPQFATVVVHPNFGSWCKILSVWQVYNVAGLSHTHGLQCESKSCAVGNCSFSSELERNVHSVQARHTQHLIHTINFRIKELDNQFVASTETVLCAENHTTGAIQVVANVLYDTWNRFCTVYVPIVIIGFCHPDTGANFNGINVCTQARCISNVKHCDICIIKTYITSTGQCGVSGCCDCCWEDISTRQLVALTPNIAQQDCLISSGCFLRKYNLDQAGVCIEQGSV